MVDTMKRNVAIILAALAAVALFAMFVHFVLVAAHLSEPAATTVYGATTRRLWATAVAVLGLVALVIGGLALRRSASRIGSGNARIRAVVALVTGLFAALNGALNLALAKGGPGTGNGVVGGAAALVLGLIAIALSGLALARLEKTTKAETCPTAFVPSAKVNRSVHSAVPDLLGRDTKASRSSAHRRVQKITTLPANANRLQGGTALADK